jgi:diaminopimelate decarboxylase
VRSDVAEGDRLPEIAAALRTAARRFGTPLYVADIATLDGAAAAVAAAFPDPWLRAYSLKANDLPALVARLAGHGYGANVVSRGEWALATRAGLPNAVITLEGIGKSDADLRAAARVAAGGAPLRWVAVESAAEASALARFVTAAGRRRPSASPLRIDVLLRLNPAVQPETHAGLATGSGASKFGMAADEMAAAIAAGGGPDGPLRWRGIHLHVGSQLGAVDAWRDAVRRGLAMLALLGGGLPEFDTLDVGGGFPVGPFGSPAPDAARFARELPALLEAIPPDRRPGRLAVEPGRLLVARSGWLLARVLHVRERTGPPATDGPAAPSGGRGLALVPPGSLARERVDRSMVIDAGMTELVRPALYGAVHGIVALTSLGRTVDQAPARSRRGARRRTRVDGPICESTDALGEHDLPALRRGDLVAIRDAGAYGASMSSRYNGRPRPAQVFLEPDGRLVLVRRRGTLGSLA